MDIVGIVLKILGVYAYLLVGCYCGGTWSKSMKIPGILLAIFTVIWPIVLGIGLLAKAFMMGREESELPKDDEENDQESDQSA